MKKKNLLGWLVRDVHPEATPSPEGEELLIYCEIPTGFIVGFAIINDLVP